MMKVKRLAIIVFSVIFVALTLISFFAYDKSSGVKIICEQDSYAQKYAKKHHIDYDLISDSDKNIGLINLDDFDYNDDGTIVSYKGDSKVIAIPESIGDVAIVRVKETAFDNAKNLKEIYLSKTLAVFEPSGLKNITVYVPEDSVSHQLMQWNENNELDFNVGEYSSDVIVSSHGDFKLSAGGTIESYTGDDSIISIPAKIGDVKITSIAKDAFISAKRLSKVYLPDSLEKFEPINVENVKFYISNDSEAYKYAKSNKSKVDFSSNTDYGSAATSLDEDFDYNENGQITEYRGVDSTIIIPESINGTKIISVSKNAFDKAENLKNIYLPESMIAFYPETLKGVKVYAPENALVNTIYKSNKFDYVNYADSYYVNFYSAEIPYSYDEISNDEIRVNKYNGEDPDIFIPETIDGKEVTAIRVDALSMGANSILIPGTVEDIETQLYTTKYDTAFYIGLLIALVGLVLAILTVIKADLSTKEKTFLRLSFFTTAYSISVLSALFTIAYLFVLPKFFTVPVWLGAVFIVILIALGVSSFVKKNTAIELIEETEKNVKVKTFFIKSLTVDAETLMSSAQTDEAKAACKKVYEAVRYSDPMSDDALASVEAQISLKFNEFSDAVNNGSDNTDELAKELLVLIENRNKKCKILK